MGATPECLSINWLLLGLKYLEVSSTYSTVDANSSEAQSKNYYQTWEARSDGLEFKSSILNILVKVC